MDILLLHGALGTGAQLRPLAARWSGRTVHAPDLSGHGGRAIPSGGLEFERFVPDIDEAIEGRRVHLFGYSMGGYAALLFAAMFPDRVASVVTLGTKLIWDREGLDRELRMLDPRKMEEKVPQFAAKLRSDHGPDRWESLIDATRTLITGLYERPLLNEDIAARITCPVLLCVGDGDRTADVEDTRAFARWIPQARVEVLPDTGHPFEGVDLDRLMAFIGPFQAAAE